MRQKAAAGFEAVEFIQVGVGKDCCELQDLVERGVCACGFGVVEGEVYPMSLTCILYYP